MYILEYKATCYSCHFNPLPSEKCWKFEGICEKGVLGEPQTVLPNPEELPLVHLTFVN
jgi:hypothetical protein